MKDKTIRKKYQSTYQWNRKGAGILFNLWNSTDAEKRRGEDVESSLLTLIREEHDRAGTFVIKVRTPKKVNQGFDMEAHKKRQLAKAAAKAKADTEGEMRPMTGSSNPNSRPNTSISQRFGFSSRPSTRQNDEAEDRVNHEKMIIGNKKAIDAVKLMLS